MRRSKEVALLVACSDMRVKLGIHLNTKRNETDGFHSGLLAVSFNLLVRFRFVSVVSTIRVLIHAIKHISMCLQRGNVCSSPKKGPVTFTYLEKKYW